MTVKHFDTSLFHQMLAASFIITVLSASMLKIAHMREKWERKLQVSTEYLA